MNEATEYWQGWRADRSARHAGWATDNRAVIAAAGISFIDRGQTLLVRIDGKPQVDFYPSTGRWRVVGISRTFRGHAHAFVAWFRTQGKRT